MAAFSTGLYYAGISMGKQYSELIMNETNHVLLKGFLYLMMGVIISSAVLPATLTLMWSKQNKWAAMLSPPLGLTCSLIAWLVTAQQESGILNVDTLGANYPMLGKLAPPHYRHPAMLTVHAAGNVVALISPCIFIPVLTYALGAGMLTYHSPQQDH